MNTIKSIKENGKIVNYQLKKMNGMIKNLSSFIKEKF